MWERELEPLDFHRFSLTPPKERRKTRGGGMAFGCVLSPLVSFAPGSSILLDAPSFGAPPFPILFPCLSYYGVISTPGTNYLSDDLVPTISFLFPLCHFLP